MRYRLPSPFEELSHTADVGIRVEAAQLDETYARAALAMAQLQTGGEGVAVDDERTLHAHGEDRASLLVDLCRKVLDVFFLERRVLGELEILGLTDTALEARAGFGPFEPDRHGEGMDLKAVTYARAAVEPATEGFVATLIFDI